MEIFIESNGINLCLMAPYGNRLLLKAIFYKKGGVRSYLSKKTRVFKGGFKKSGLSKNPLLLKRKCVFKEWFQKCVL